MELSAVIVFSLVLYKIAGDYSTTQKPPTGSRNGYADDRLRAFARRLSAMEYSAANTKTTMLEKFNELEWSLESKLTDTIVPPLVNRQVKQAITDLLKEDYIGNIISAHVLEEVNSLKSNVQNIKTQFKALSQKLRHVEKEKNMYREDLGKVRDELNVTRRDIRVLEEQARSHTRMSRTELDRTMEDPSNTRQAIVDFTQDVKKMNRRWVKTRKEVKSCRKDLVEMQRTLPADIDRINTELSRTILDLSSTRQVMDGLTQDVKKLNISWETTEKDLGKVRDELNETRRDINVLEEQARSHTRMLRSELNGTMEDLSNTRQVMDGLTQDVKELTTCCVMRNETAPRTTTASTDPSLRTTVPPVTVTTQDSDQHASTDPSLSTTVPPVTVTTQDSDQHATPSAATGDDLWRASYRGDLETVRRIVAAGGVDVNYGEGLSSTPVMAAAEKGHREVVEFLVGEGADLSLVDGFGDNALHFACYGEGDLEIVKLILSLDVVDVNARGNFGQTAADMARHRGYQQVVDLLVSRGAE